MGIIILVQGALAAPGTPEVISVTETSWAVAGSGTAVKIQVQVVDDGGDGVNGQNVQFINNNPELGSLSDLNPTSDGSGYAETFFIPDTISGTANITAIVTSFPLVNTTIDQEIDHNNPYRVSYRSYVDDSNQVPVGTTIPLAIGLKDQYGNPVDDRNTIETIKFVVTSPSSGAHFSDGTRNTLTGVNATGYVNEDLTVDTLAGINYLRYTPPDPIPWEDWTVYGLGESIPASFPEPDVAPGYSVSADGVSVFTITYSLYDQYGNPASDCGIDVTTTLGESHHLTTNMFGEAVMTYGPRDILGAVDIIARSTYDPSLNHTFTLNFASLAGKNLYVTVIPDNMASWDVKPESSSEIQALVTDDLGNPVEGVKVVFDINDDTIQSNMELEADPYIDGNGIIYTGESGFAIANFNAGEFPEITYNASDPIFYIGNCTVDVTLYAEDGITEVDTMTTGLITWRNYPYLRLEIDRDPDTILKPGEYMDITLRLIGDGHELGMRKPVDIVLATSRSYSMYQEYPDRMVYAYAAEKAFLDILISMKPDEGEDAVGLLSFGAKSHDSSNNSYIPDMASQFLKLVEADNIAGNYTWYLTHYPGSGYQNYDDYSTMDEPFTDDLQSLKIRVDYTTPWQDKTLDGQTAMMPVRLAVYRSIRQLIENSTTGNELKAIVLLVDSDISDYGDVLAEGSAGYDYLGMTGGTNRYFPFTDQGWNETDPRQNMSVYANENNVRIYVVYAASKVNQADWTTLNTLATTTGGAFNSTSGDAANLVDIYDWIAHQLIVEAGVNTTMDLNFVDLEGSDNVTYTGSDLMEYEYVQAGSVSTMVRQFKWDTSPYTPTTPVSFVKPEICFDQTADWADNILEFNETYIGTIKVKETWETRFRLRINESLNKCVTFDSLFSAGSFVNFNEGLEQLTISGGGFTTCPNMTAINYTNGTLALSPITIIDEDENFVQFNWTVTYDGNGTYWQEVAYQSPGGMIVPIETIFNADDHDSELRIADLADGDYNILVMVHSSDAGSKDASKIYSIDRYKTQIKIE